MDGYKHCERGVMNTTGDVLELVRRANPVPDLDWFDPDEAAAGIAVIEAAWQRETKSSPVESRAGRYNPMSLRYSRPFLAAALITLVLIGGPMIVGDRRGTPVVEESTITTPATETTAPAVTTETAATPTTTTLPAIVTMPGLTFTQAPHIAGFDDGFINKIITGGPGLIAVGTTQVCGTTDGEFGCVVDGAVWVSSDGLSWELVDDPTVFTGSEDARYQGATQWISDVTSGPLGIIAVGYDGYDGAVWVSPGGLVWSRVPSETLGAATTQSLNAVASGGPGLVAVGRVGSDAAVWVSEDALTWTRVEDPDLDTGREPTEIWTLGATANGFLGAGEIGFDEGMAGQGTGTRPIMWFSADGLDWERITGDTLKRYGVDGISSIQGGDRFLIIGETEDGEGIWTSEDASTWQKIDVPYMDSSDKVGSVDHIGTRWDGSRWVSVGFEESTGTVWASFELGVPWQPVGHIEIGDIPYDIMDVTATKSGVVIALATWENNDQDMRAVIWNGTWDE